MITVFSQAHKESIRGDDGKSSIKPLHSVSLIF